MDAPTLAAGIDQVAQRDRTVAVALKEIGYPAPRINPPGFKSLVRILVGQQLSIKAAASIFERFCETLKQDVTPQRVLACSDDALRRAGFSRSKVVYVKGAASAAQDGALCFDAISNAGEADAMAMLTALKGVGPWSAQIYLLFCEARQDIWPAGDLALQEALKRLKGLSARPAARETEPLVAPWSPHRGAMAIFLWHYYAQTDAPI